MRLLCQYFIIMQHVRCVSSLSCTQIIPLSVIKIKRCLILLGFELSIQVMSNAKFEFFAVLQNSGKAQASETVMM